MFQAHRNIDQYFKSILALLEGLFPHRPYVLEQCLAFFKFYRPAC